MVWRPDITFRKIVGIETLTMYGADEKFQLWFCAVRTHGKSGIFISQNYLEILKDHFISDHAKNDLLSDQIMIFKMTPII